MKHPPPSPARLSLVLAGIALASCERGSMAAPDQPGLSPSGGTPETRSVRIAWETASEFRSFGFFILRSDAEDGPFSALQATPLAGGGTTDEPRSYVYIDDTAIKEKDYYYFVENLTYDNRRRAFSPVFRSEGNREP